MSLRETVDRYRGGVVTTAFAVAAATLPVAWQKLQNQPLENVHVVMTALILPFAALWMYGTLNGDRHPKADEYDPKDHAHRNAFMRGLMYVIESTNETHITRGTQMLKAGLGAGAGLMYGLERDNPGITSQLFNDTQGALMQLRPEHIIDAGYGVLGCAAGWLFGGLVVAPVAHGLVATWNHMRAALKP